MAKRIILHGKCMKILPAEPSYSPNYGRDRGPAVDKEFRPMENLIRARDRSKNTFIWAAQTIENEFLSAVDMVIPKQVLRRIERQAKKQDDSSFCHLWSRVHKERFYYNEQIRLLREFGKAVEKQYPDCFFIWIYGWSRKAELHMHLLGTFGVHSSHRKMETELLGIWLRILNMDKKTLDAKVIHLKKYVEGACLGYLTKPWKNDEMLIMISKTGRKHCWGLIGRNNIQWAQRQERKVSDKETARFRIEMASKAEQEGLAKSTQNRFRREILRTAFLNKGVCEFAEKRVAEFEEDK